MNMIYCGIDLGTRSSAICIVNKEHIVVEEWHGKNSDLLAVLKRYTSNKENHVQCLVEAAPLAETVCRKVEAIGGHIEIVDSKATKSLLRHGKKTDKVDAHALADIAVIGWYNVVYRKDSKNRKIRSILKMRSSLVRASTKLKNTIRGTLKANSIVIEKLSDGKVFMNAVIEASKRLSPDVRTFLTDLLKCWIKMHKTILKMTKHLANIAKKNQVATLLMTVVGVGPATALCYVSTIDNPSRFKSKSKVSSYLGLAPSTYQSGDTSYTGRITKQGDEMLRWHLYEAATCILSKRNRYDFNLKDWGLRLKDKVGYKKAKVAVARKLSGILWSMWITGSEFKKTLSTVPKQ